MPDAKKLTVSVKYIDALDAFKQLSEIQLHSSPSWLSKRDEIGSNLQNIVVTVEKKTNRTQLAVSKVGHYGKKDQFSMEAITR